MTVRRKLACSVAVLLLLSGGSSVLSLAARQRAEKEHTSLQQVQQRHQRLVAADRELQLRWRELRVLSELSPSPPQVMVLRGRLQNLDSLAGTVGGANDDGFGRQYRTLSNSWHEVLNRLELRQSAGAPMDPAEVFDTLQRLQRIATQQMELLSVQFVAATQASHRVTLGLLAMALACGVCVVVWLSLTISSGLKQLHLASTYVARGDYAFRLPPGRAQDEFAEAAHAYNNMAEALAIATQHSRVAREMAEQASAAKSGFLMSMSHDLRTPLTAILGYADLVGADAQRAGLASTVADVGQLRCSAHVLLGMVGELLDYARLEAGRMPVALDVVEPDAMVREVAATLHPLLEQRGNTFVLHDGCTDVLTTDRAMLRHILLNLMGNACKFTDRGRIEVVLDGLPARGKGLLMQVRDTGIGMSAGEAARIFSPYEQANGDILQRYGGSGLGLTIARRFVELLEGVIDVESQIGVGTTFTVWLPDLGAALDANAQAGEFEAAAALFDTIDASAPGAERLPA